jgi:hypothetical protein
MSMSIATKIVWDMETKLILAKVEYEYCGPVDRACGASRQQKDAFAQEQKVSGLLTENFTEFAGDNKAILKNITEGLTPIAEAGPSQFGFAPAEEAALRTDAAEQLNAAGANATNAVRAAVASQGGGTTFLPSGSSASILGALAQDTAVKEAEAQSGITAKGYDIGRENWMYATKELAAAPGELENPVTSAGGAAVSAADLEQQGAKAITDAQNAWMAPVGQIIGGVAGALIPTPKKGGGGVQGPSWATGG